MSYKVAKLLIDSLKERLKSDSINRDYYRALKNAIGALESLIRFW